MPLVLPQVSTSLPLATPVPAVPGTPAPQRLVPTVRRKPLVPPEYVGDPVHLTATAYNLQPGSGGAGVNVKALVNPGPGPIEVHGLKFRVRSPTYVPTGALVGCRLDLGEFALTNGFVPIFAFGRAENLVAEQVTASRGAGGVTVPSFAYAQYTARLARPIFLPAGAAIRPSLLHKGQATAAVDVSVSIFGRQLDPRTAVPTRLKLPYWAAYVSKTFQLGVLDSDNSSESDLWNPFDVPMEMERFVGRINYTSDSWFLTGSLMTELESSLLANQPGGLPYVGDALGQITMTMADSNGFPVVKRPTPFRLVFDALTRSWPVSNVLPSNGFYLVSLGNAPWLYGASPAVINAQATVSMLGWREVV